MVFKLGIIEAWAGIGAFSDGFHAMAAAFPAVTVACLGWIERDSAAVQILSAFYSEACQCLDFYSYSWRSWSLAHHDMLLLCGGFSCCTLSKAGKQLWASDPRSSQGMDTARLAVEIGADAVLLENVHQLITDDSLHGFYSEIRAFLLANGFVEIGVFWLTDSECAGRSSRCRVLPYFEKRSIAALLPPVSLETLSPSRIPGCIADVLDPVAEVEHMVLPGTFSPGADVVVSTSSPTVAGRFSFKGPEKGLVVGMALKLRNDPRTWVIRAVNEQSFTLFFNSHSAPLTRRFNRKDSRLRGLKVVRQNFRVLDVRGIGAVVRRTFIPPEGMMLILDPRLGGSSVRTLSSNEAWRVCSLSEEKLAFLAARSLDPQPLAGNAIPVPITSVAAEVVLERLERAHDAAKAIAAGSFLCCPTGLALDQSGLDALFVLLLSASNEPAEAVSGSAGGLPCWLGALTQGEAFDKGVRFAEECGASGASSVAMVFEQKRGDSRIFVVAIPLASLADLNLPGDLVVRQQGDVVCVDTALAELLMTASLRIRALSRPTTVPASAWSMGRVSGAASVLRPDPTAPSTAEEERWFEAVSGDRLAEEQLALHLRSISDDSVYFTGWADATEFVDPLETPAHLRRCHDFSEPPVDQRGVDLLFSTISEGSTRIAIESELSGCRELSACTNSEGRPLSVTTYSLAS